MGFSIDEMGETVWMTDVVAGRWLVRLADSNPVQNCNHSCLGFWPRHPRILGIPLPEFLHLPSARFVPIQMPQAIQNLHEKRGTVLDGSEKGTRIHPGIWVPDLCDRTGEQGVNRGYNPVCIFPRECFAG